MCVDLDDVLDELFDELLLDVLLDDIVQEGLGEVLLDLLLDEPVRCEIGDVGSVGGASTPGEHTEDTAVPVEDDRA